MTDSELAIPEANKDKVAALYRIWLLVIVVAAVVLVSMGYIYYAGRQMAAVHTPLIDAAMEIKFEATTAHLWLEEAISGDQTVTMGDILNHIDEADWYANAMLEGGTSAEGRFYPLSDSQTREDIVEVRKKLAEFKEVAVERWEAKASTGVGSEIDQRFDRMFKDLITQADVVETDLQRVTAVDLRRFAKVQTTLMASCVLLTLAVGMTFGRFARRQLRDQQKLLAANQQLDATNQQLLASEQQLKATNQQLMASDQQLRAANQQLTATNQQLASSDQQLKAANQQLMASDQQLRAANQQLTATNQQLEASNQQLSASQEEVSALARFPAENPYPVIRVSKEGTIVYANKGSDCLLASWACKVGGQLPQKWRQLASDVLDSGQNKEADVEYDCCSLSLTFAPIKDLGYINIYGLDITQRRKAEEQLRQTRANLEHTARLITAGEMASGLAHELNQPLCAILNYANACLRAIRAKGIEQDQLVETLNDIAGQADRAGEIIRRLRSLVRKREPKQSAVNINKIVEDVIKLEHAEALEQGIELFTELAENIESVTADDVQVQQVVLNLVRNGFEAMVQTPRNNRRLTIRTIAIDGDRIEIAVCDSGRGLSKDTAERMFDSFFSTRAEGLGVGLSLSRSIIEAHHGKIWAEPNTDCGATVRFTLPVKGTKNG